MIKTLILTICVISLSGCATQAQKVAVPTPAPIDLSNPLVLAVDLIEKNNLPEAKKVLEDFVSARPANWSHRVADDKEVRVFFWDKEQLAACGLFEIVAAQGKKMEPVLDASYSKAYYLLAFIALESRNNPYNNALLNLNKGLALESDQPSLLYEKASLFYRIKRYEHSVEEYKRLLQTTACFSNPQRARAYRGLGEALTAMGKYDDAELAFYQSLKFDPDNKKAIAELDYIDKVRNINVRN